MRIPALALLLALGASAPLPAPARAQERPGPGAPGPATAPVDNDSYAAMLHVSASTGSDQSGDGSRERPWATLAHALGRTDAARSGSRIAVLVAEGTYAGATVEMRPDVDLLGGHDPSDWSRDVFAHPTILDGEGARRIAVGADDAVLDGFVLRNGSVSGHGGALLAEGTSPTISNNVFAANRTTRPVPWAPAHWHETAHDGGAIACRNGCSALIEGNLFVDNATEIGRGGAFACDNEAAEVAAAPRVERNVFLRNAASAARFAADTARSGDGGAISYYGRCRGRIADNVVAENAAESRNDGGGIFVALWSTPEVARNVIVGNVSGDDAGGLFVGGQKHHYGTPEDPVPPAGAYSVAVIGNVFMGNRNGAPSSGAFRATMQSRGVFYNNVTAENPGGVHTQSSELTLAHNTFAESARYEGSARAAPGPVVFRNNIILGERNWEEPVTDERNQCPDPRFVEDALEIASEDVTFDPARHVTLVRWDGSAHAEGALARRVVRAGERWGVIRSNDAGTLEIWGDFTPERRFAVQPSYHLAADSPCIDQGVAIEGPDRDIDGDPRPIGPAPDLGADEHWPHGSARAQAGVSRPTGSAPAPARINKAIELLERGQPIYYASGAGGYEEGTALAQTWADYIWYDMEHAPFDVARLGEFMRGLVDGGPTPSGHRTPAVIVTLPAGGLDESTMRANAWMVQQVLATGVHGIHLVRARSPEAVGAFVQAARYPIHHQAEDVLGVGLRGWGSQRIAAEIWGIEPQEYLRRADVWPLNPEGELLLGVKIEDPEALERAEETAKVPGIAFAEHGPRDMGLSYGYLEGRADPPVPPEVEAAGQRVLAAARAAGIYFLDNVLPENVCRRIEEGVMIGAGRLEEAAEVGRRCTKREMPW